MLFSILILCRDTPNIIKYAYSFEADDKLHIIVINFIVLGLKISIYFSKSRFAFLISALMSPHFTAFIRYIIVKRRNRYIP